jgi:hypothetical protein
MGGSGLGRPTASQQVRSSWHSLFGLQLSLFQASSSTKRRTSSLNHPLLMRICAAAS